MRSRSLLSLRSSLAVVLLLCLLFAFSLNFENTTRADGLIGPEATGQIVFAESGQIFKIGADGSGLTQLTFTGETVYNYQPSVSPDGTRVAFGNRHGESSQIMVMNIDGSDVHSLTTNLISTDSEPAWSPDGQQIAFVRGFDATADGVANFSSCGSEIYVVAADGSTPVPTNITGGNGGTDPSWSPDGTRIAYVNSANFNFDIFSIDVASGKVQQLTRTAEHEAEPRWSPDGTQILFARGYVHAMFDCGFAHTGLGFPWFQISSDIYRMTVDGQSETRMTETEDNFDPAWSPDGSAITFVSRRNDETQVFTLDPQHKHEYAITTSPGEKSSPSWTR